MSPAQQLTGSPKGIAGTDAISTGTNNKPCLFKGLCVQGFTWSDEQCKCVPTAGTGSTPTGNVFGAAGTNNTSGGTTGSNTTSGTSTGIENKVPLVTLDQSLINYSSQSNTTTSRQPTSQSSQDNIVA